MGFCHYCDQPFDKGHKCQEKTTQLFLIEIPGEEGKENEGTNEFSREINFGSDEAEPRVPMNAMNGAGGFLTMRINGHLGKKTLHIPIDSGNPHNFLDVNLAKKLGCKMEPMAMQS